MHLTKVITYHPYLILNDSSYGITQSFESPVISIAFPSQWPSVIRYTTIRVQVDCHLSQLHNGRFNSFLNFNMAIFRPLHHEVFFIITLLCLCLFAYNFIFIHPFFCRIITPFKGALEFKFRELLIERRSFCVKKKKKRIEHSQER